MQKQTFLLKICFTIFLIFSWLRKQCVLEPVEASGSQSRFSHIFVFEKFGADESRPLGSKVL